MLLRPFAFPRLALSNSFRRLSIQTPLMSDGPPPAKKARHAGSKPWKQSKISKKQAAKAAAKAGQVTGSGDEVLQYSVVDVLGQERVDQLTAEGKDNQSPFEHLQEVEVDIVALGSHGACDMNFQ